jgi:PEP-CTERM motif-containing protein
MNALYEAGFGGLPDNLNIDTVFNVQADVIFAVEVQVNAGAFASGFAQASVDPVFSVPAGYSLEFDPGVGNLASTVPEPPTWVMMLLGFVGLGFVGYRASRKSVALAA